MSYTSFVSLCSKVGEGELKKRRVGEKEGEKTVWPKSVDILGNHEGGDQSLGQPGTSEFPAVILRFCYPLSKSRIQVPKARDAPPPLDGTETPCSRFSKCRKGEKMTKRIWWRCAHFDS
jgi:hypothetical protein